VDGRPARPGAVFPADRIAGATYKPELGRSGPAGTFDILVEDGRGGSVLGSLSISVVHVSRPPVVEPSRRLRIYTGGLGIKRPEGGDGEALTVQVTSVPRGLVRNGAVPVHLGDRLAPEALPALVFIPEPGFAGAAGSFGYQVDNGQGGTAASAVELDVMDAAEAAGLMAEAALWDRVRGSTRSEDLDAFVRLYPNSRFGPAAAQRRAELSGRRDAAATPAGPPPARPAAAVPGPVAARPVAALPDAPQPARPPAASAPPAPAPPSSGPAAPRPRPDPTRLAMQGPAKPPRVAPAEPALPTPAPAPGPAAAPMPAAAPVLAPAVAPAAMHGERNCPVMTEVPGGGFMMGTGTTDPTARPPHQVAVRPFLMGQGPVTVADWNACRADGGCGPPPRMAVAEDATPLHNASWDDAQQYVAWLSRAAGRPYRLPSEAEWEYAARGGTSTRYWWGGQLGAGLANCADCGGPQDPRAPAPALAYQPNGFGLYGMLGGVAQWVQDCWHPTYAGAPGDGTAWEGRGCSQRVLRGGSFRAAHDDIAPVARSRYDAPVRYFTNGFRVARNVE